MNPINFDYIAALLRQASGLILGPDKGYLLESRLAPLAKKHGCDGIDELITRLRTTHPQDLIRQVVEAMTTNESFFFRDVKPFDAFRDIILPELMRRRESTRTLRIWSAAASTGQEPYSLAMILREEAAKLVGWTCEILGTDLSTEVLARATAGVYTQLEVQRGLSIQRLIQHFDKAEANWRIKPELRDKVRYRPFNLLDDPRTLGRFDIIFCRNVLIYFDQETKSRVFQSLANVLNENGILVLGGAETVFGLTKSFLPWGEQHGLYRLEPSADSTPLKEPRALAVGGAR